MSQEQMLGKYEFYPYPEELVEPPPTLEELVEMLRETKPEKEKDDNSRSRSIGGCEPRRKPRG